ncbi:GNAT family protein [uncultured Brevundimonas sp.]|uniref:GNAT family N-acetyltransferase n=1 Tax=uncultured Brevundimonas sp. TaxID=213418 RepID=UPI00263287C1|nr:GNAT family protein [uncultured Brevundimonas sp.]
MALFDWKSEHEGPVLEGAGVVLRPPRPSDYLEWATIREASRDYLQPWEPAWSVDDLSRAAYKRRLQVYAREMELGTAYPFFVMDAQTNALVGAITLSNIRRGVAETGTLGYWIGQPYAGEGRGTAAVGAMLQFAFGDLKLHRVEAACVPHNHASQRVLEKSGFRREGLAKAYLKINGLWADHILFAVLESDLGGRPRPERIV